AGLSAGGGRMDEPGPGRALIVIADDFGIGPETSRGILEVAGASVVTGAVLLTNSPFAEAAVRQWRKLNPPADLGWHPCLTMDAPVSLPREVPSLLARDGNLPPLRNFLPPLLTGRIRPEEIRRELAAQHRRFQELTGQEPVLVNTHQHVGLFGPVGAILREL